MYQPAHGRFVEPNVAKLQRLIHEYPLGTLVTHTSGDVEINHVPFLIDDATNKLAAHVPRANPVWQALDGRPALIVFHGPNAYISPNWYVSKRHDDRVVPTWNYAVVHARGIAHAIEDKGWLKNHLHTMTTTHEAMFENPWRVADAPADYIDKLLGAIVGLEIVVTKLEGKFKLGQNRSQEDQESVNETLTAAGSTLGNFSKEYDL